MSKRVLIGGIGNVLLGDDAVGPYVIRLLESEYAFGDDVEIADLGTPALDLTHRLAGLRAAILVDCVASDEHPSGTVLLYRKGDILRIEPAQRLDPHSPALSECLMTTEMLGASPEYLILVGVVGQCFDPGQTLTTAVEQAAASAVRAILVELQKLKIPCVKREPVVAPALWWCERFQNLSTGNG
jgi:hydrogenase maturation protease